jgi:hypothetical protein
MGDFFTAENVDLMIRVGVIVIIVCIVLWIIRKIRRAVNLVKNVALTALIESEGREREARLSTPGGSSETQHKASGVRVALREQKTNCSSCGAPNNSVVDFCPYCGSSLIK